MTSPDIIVVGAGIIGLSIAYQIARRNAARVLVLDKAGAVASGSTGASSAICRYRYSLDDMILLARDGIHAYRQWRAFTELTAPRARFENVGVLWLTGTDTQFGPRGRERLHRFGIPAEVLDDDDLRRRFPSLSRCTRSPDIETGQEHDCEEGGRYLFEPAGGYVDPVAAAEDLAEAARAKGVAIRLGSRVKGVTVAAGRAIGVELEGGESIPAETVVNAAGPWCRDLHRSTGLELTWDLAPTRIQVLYLKRGPELTGHIPVVADIAGGIYFRTQNRGQQLVVGSLREEDEQETVTDPDVFQTVHDDDFAYRTLHIMGHRLPALPQRGAIRGFCGLYTVNRDDVHPLLGPTEVEGYWVANGFSGHGFKIAPAVGALIAEALCGALPDDDFRSDAPLATFSMSRRPIDVASKSVIA